MDASTHTVLNRYGFRIIAGLFLLLTLSGIFYNYPLSTTVGDETVLMAASLKMMSERSLRPDYPTNYHMPFGAYLYLPFFAVFFIFLRLSGVFGSIAELTQFGILEHAKLLPFARFISILLGLASLYLLYRICRKLFSDSRVALFASFLLATDLMFVFLSHFGKVWVPQIFTILLALYAIVSLYRAPAARLRDYMLIGVLTAAAFATHVVGLLVYLPFVVVHYYKNAGKRLAEIFISNKNFWICNAVVILLIAFTYYLNPYGFENYFAQSTAAAQSVIGDSQAQERNVLQGFSFYAIVLWEYAPLLLLLFLFGAWKLWQKNREPFFILMSFAVGYYLAIGPFLGSTHAQPHYIAPAMPFLAAIGAYGLVSFLREHATMRTRSAKMVLLTLLVLASFYLPTLFGYRLMQETTQQQFLRWLYATVPAGTTIVNFDAYLPINENRASILLTERLNPAFLQKRQKYLLGLPDAAYPAPNYFVLPALYKGGFPREIDRKQFSYAVISWYLPEEHALNLERAREFGVADDKLLALFPPGAAVDTFGADLENIRRPIIDLPRMTHTGPKIAVYKLR